MFKKIILAAGIIFSVNVYSYDRKDWPHWSKSRGTCLNMRQEILKNRSKSPIQYKDNKKCTVLSGSWDDYYYPETLTKSADIDIDHIIPLKHADSLVGNTWGRELKEKFANDPENLAITNKSYNRQKGAKTITEWLPVHKTYACRYMSQWLYIKRKYNLPVSDQERETFLLAKCH